MPAALRSILLCSERVPDKITSLTVPTNHASCPCLCPPVILRSRSRPCHREDSMTRSVALDRSFPRAAAAGKQASAPVDDGDAAHGLRSTPGTPPATCRIHHPSSIGSLSPDRMPAAITHATSAGRASTTPVPSHLPVPYANERSRDAACLPACLLTEMESLSNAPRGGNNTSTRVVFSTIYQAIQASRAGRGWRQTMGLVFPSGPDRDLQAGRHGIYGGESTHARAWPLLHVLVNGERERWRRGHGLPAALLNEIRRFISDDDTCQTPTNFIQQATSACRAALKKKKKKKPRTNNDHVRPCRSRR